MLKYVDMLTKSNNIFEVFLFCFYQFRPLLKNASIDKEKYWQIKANFTNRDK